MVAMKFLHNALNRLPKRVIYGLRGPYLTKYTIANFGKKYIRVYLHCIYHLHNHPWKWAIVIILRGGYVEERLTGLVGRRPGSVVVLTHDTWHRIDTLCDKNSWSLFIAGPEKGAWHFLDGVTIPHGT